MYIPKSFEETDRDKLFRFMEAYSFALLVSNHQGGLFASHLPFLLERETGPSGTLLGHMARANPQWREVDGQEVLIVYSGPHAYVSPTWYESDNVVPTWNYVAVHAYGRCRLVEEDDLVAILKDTVHEYEHAMPEPWQLDTGRPYFQKMVRAVVGFRVEISRLEGKWKLNQNQPPERREKVRHVLRAAHTEDAREIARLMGEQPG